MLLTKILSLTVLNYLLLAIEISFQCGATEILVSKLEKKRHMVLCFEETELAKSFLI